ncbi:hypothetical protein Desku_0828 [Desulfofundulus kuznetsovii DSM 6115]|uniref:Uncharacterized protein n=1 Tax=Desulfofundulus kuznetsovii (strain DSM 6115 / VKM B-1805 / 17) TaxID=760568 RepID=A0AAU8Q1A8_DESK7|nr:hypothetical protein Desku_0828 [Desulfofundulus kuznetsovii DSM 6115]
MDARDQILNLVFDVFVEEASRVKTLIKSGSISPDEFKVFVDFTSLVLDLYGLLCRK